MGESQPRQDIHIFAAENLVIFYAGNFHDWYIILVTGEFRRSILHPVENSVKVYIKLEEICGCVCIVHSPTKAALS